MDFDINKAFKKNPDGKDMMDNGSFISSIFYLYLNKMKKKGMNPDLSLQDLSKLPPKMSINSSGNKFIKYYLDIKKKNPKKKLWKILARYVSQYFI